MSLLARETNWMETFFKQGDSLVIGDMSLLARETNWMETSPKGMFQCPVFSPYSLGKLIEWKQTDTASDNRKSGQRCPYSLGKLIEWKQIDSIQILTDFLVPTR